MLEGIRSVQVEPRTTVQGDVVAVMVMLRGVGNVEGACTNGGGRVVGARQGRAFSKKSAEEDSGLASLRLRGASRRSGHSGSGRGEASAFDPTNQSYRVAEPFGKSDRNAIENGQTIEAV